MGSGSGRGRRRREARAAGRVRVGANTGAALRRAQRNRRGNEGVVTAAGRLRNRPGGLSGALRRIQRNARRAAR